MLLLLCILYLVQVIQAAPTTNSTTMCDGSEALSSMDQRTLWSIVSTCTLTLFACIYSVIHPNIPSPNDDYLRVLWRRFGIMVLAILAPDLIVVWSLRQWFWARHITTQFQEHFSVHHPKDWSEINECAEAPAVQHEGHAGTQAVAMHPEGESLDNAAEQHEDHAGAQAVVTGAKAYEGTHARAKPSKESPEVDDAEQSQDYTWTQTHSFFALMGGFMLYVDGKPYLTLSPDHLLYLIRTRSIYGPTLTEKQISDRSKGNAISKGSIVLQGAWFILQLLSRAIYRLEPTQLEVGTFAFAVLNFITYALWWNKPLDIECAHPVYWKSTDSEPEVYSYDVSENHDFARVVEVSVLQAGVTLFEFLGIHAMSSQKLRVATYDGIHHVKLNPGESNFMMFAGFTMTTIFGSIHCAAWFYSFPTFQEQVVWRTSATVITTIPWIGLVVGFVLYIWRPEHKDSVMYKVLLLTCPVLYFIARIIISILMFTTLRSLPPDAYKEVSWSNLLPHL